MYESLSIIQNIAELGLIYALVVLSMHISSRTISFDDLTVDGSFTTGGAVAAQLVLLGMNSWLSLPLVALAGCTLGIITGLLHTKLGMNNLLSGIVVTTAAWSINLKIAGPNNILPNGASLFDLPIIAALAPYHHLIALLLLVLLIYTGVNALLKTEIGFMLKAVGDNPQMLTNLGKNIHLYKIGGLALSNSITALAGALFVHQTGFFSITTGIGTIIIALAGLILSRAIIKKSLYGLMLGAIAYQAIIALTIELQLDPAWNKLISALLIVVLIVISRNQKETLNGRYPR